MAKEDQEKLGLNVDLQNMTDADYRKLWNKFGRIEIKVIEKNGQCHHNVGDTFYYGTPYKKPQEVCAAALNVLDLYTWRVFLGYPSWDSADRSVYKIHCPDHTGIVWSMRLVK